jgi:hypothetical protein
MIILTMASAASLLSLQASVIAPRTAFAACIKEASSKAVAEKVKPDGFGDYIRSACTPAGAKFKNALVAFDTKNGVARGRAAQDAQMELDDSFESAARTYKRLNSEDPVQQ